MINLLYSMVLVKIRVTLRSPYSAMRLSEPVIVVSMTNSFLPRTLSNLNTESKTRNKSFLECSFSASVWKLVIGKEFEFANVQQHIMPSSYRKTVLCGAGWFTRGRSSLSITQLEERVRDKLSINRLGINMMNNQTTCSMEIKSWWNIWAFVH